MIGYILCMYALMCLVSGGTLLVHVVVSTTVPYLLNYKPGLLFTSWFFSDQAYNRHLIEYILAQFIDIGLCFKRMRNHQGF